jgi:Na+/melibiose symporter-like transporter
VGRKGALALVVATFAFVLVAVSAATMVAPLYAWDPQITQERTRVWLTAVRICCSVLTIGILALAVIAAFRLIVAG